MNLIKFRDMILVTNYQTGLRAEPIESVMPNKRISFDAELMEVTINESVIIGVFDTLPYMRNIPANKKWFDTNIYHLR